MAYTLKEETRIKRENEFKKKLKELSNGELILIDKFINVKKKIKMKNIILNEEFEICPSSIIGWCSRNPGKYYRSPNYNIKVQNENKKLNFEQAYNKVKEYTNEFTLLEYYSSRKCLLRHNNCGNEYITDFTGIFRNKSGCMKCKKTKPLNNQDFLDRIYKLVGNEYHVLEKYTRMIDKIEFKHSKCGKKFKMTPNNFIHSGNRCPFCSHIVRQSKPVTKIENYLINNNFDYTKEFIFEDLYTEFNNRKYFLPFDFKINTKNGFILLEYDGYQHENGWNGNPKSKENNIKRDIRKNEFCKNKNIPLYRINYKDENRVIEILEKILSSTTIL